MSHVSEPHAANLSNAVRPESAGRPLSVTASSALIWAGIVLFVLGLLAIIVTFVVPFLDVRISDSFYLLSMLAPAGMVIGVLGALASGRRARG